MILVGCNLFLIRSLALFRSSEAIMTTEVVPSPTSLSYSCESCTITLAAGCSTSSCLRIVAPQNYFGKGKLLPSFVIVISPISSTKILSNPEGPNVFFTIFAIAKIAVTILTFYYRCLFLRLVPSHVLPKFLLMGFDALRYYYFII
jgi:hypothetical protein